MVSMFLVVICVMKFFSLVKFVANLSNSCSCVLIVMDQLKHGKVAQVHVR